MKYFLILMLCLCIGACSHRNPLSDMNFQTISAPPHVLASWYKITTPGTPLKVYIEGDGHSFTATGYPSDNPTPQDEFMRQIAADDPSPNVAYLARPCQYLQVACTQTDWTTGRFSQQIINDMDTAIASLMKKAKTDRVILIGYSGGAQIAGLIAARHPDKTSHLITIAGVLDHNAWTNYHRVAPLTDSLNLATEQSKLSAISQTHYIGTKDDVVPPDLARPKVMEKYIILVPGATHNKGYDKILPKIYEVQQ